MHQRWMIELKNVVLRTQEEIEDEIEVLRIMKPMLVRKSESTRKDGYEETQG